MSRSIKAVFLSYAREDAAAARRIAEALRGFGVEVWFDQHELRGGDQWDAKVRQQVRECALFVPIISATTEARREGYFRREWGLAADRTHDMGKRAAFLVPVVIDATPESGADVPDEFLRVQWTRLPSGVPSPQFVEQVRRLLEPPSGSGSERSDMPAARERLAADAPNKTLTRSATSKRTPFAISAAVGVVAAIALFVWFGATKIPSGPVAAPPAAPKTTGASPAAKSAPADKSIAVLPFANLSDDKDANAFFADGIHEDILTETQRHEENRTVRPGSNELRAFGPWRFTSDS